MSNERNDAIPELDERLVSEDEGTDEIDTSVLEATLEEERAHALVADWSDDDETLDVPLHELEAADGVEVFEELDPLDIEIIARDDPDHIEFATTVMNDGWIKIPPAFMDRGSIAEGKRVRIIVITDD